MLFHADMLFQHGELGNNPAGFADIGVFCQTAGTEAIFPQPLARIPCTAVLPRGFGLHPVQEAEAELLGAAQVVLCFCFRDAYQQPKPIIDLRPVDQGDIARKKSFRIILAVEDAPEMPHVFLVSCIGGAIKERPANGALVGGLRCAPTQLGVRPEISLEAEPESIIFRFVDNVVFTREIVQSEAPGVRLLIQGVGMAGESVQFTRLGLRFCANDMFNTCQGQQVAEFCGIQNIFKMKVALQSGNPIQKGNCVNTIACDFSPDRLMRVRYL